MERKTEYKHRKELDEIYLLYSVLRDFYKYNSKNEKNPSKIASIIATKVGREVYIRYKKNIKRAITTVDQLLNYKHIKRTNISKMEINIIISNKDFFKRLIIILDNIYIHKNIDTLLHEIKLENEDNKNIDIMLNETILEKKDVKTIDTLLN